MVNENVPELVCPIVSVANTEYTLVAAVTDGVPEISPIVSLNNNPSGNGLFKVYVICPSPPVAKIGITGVILVYLVKIKVELLTVIDTGSGITLSKKLLLLLCNRASVAVTT